MLDEPFLTIHLAYKVNLLPLFVIIAFYHYKLNKNSLK